MTDTYIEISIEEYVDLRRAQEELYMLGAAGVDNWSGFEDAMFPADAEDYDTMIKRVKKEVYNKYGS